MRHSAKYSCCVEKELVFLCILSNRQWWLCIRTMNQANVGLLTLMMRMDPKSLTAWRSFQT